MHSIYTILKSFAILFIAIIKKILSANIPVFKNSAAPKCILVSLTYILLSPCKIDAQTNSYPGQALDVLPVDMLTFNVIAVNNNSISIKWQTATEVNNHYFTVERSVDGKKWEPVAVVNGKGNSTITSNYSAVDPNPYAGDSYYRIRQTDYDGRIKFSLAKIIKIDKLENKELVVYPNPVVNQVRIKIEEAELKTLKVYSNAGQDVSNFVKTIANNNTIMTLDASKLPAGVYIIKTNTGSTKILKQ